MTNESYIFTDERGRWCVRVIWPDRFTSTHVALSKADADDFAASPERQAADRRLAFEKWKARLGR